MIGGIIVTHGPMAQPLIAAAETILGKADNIRALSTTPFSLKEIVSEVEKIIEKEAWDDGVLVMASLRGGSCWNAAVLIANKKSNVQVVSGVNLPMVISFLSKRNSLSLSELAETVYHDGVRGIAKL
ncbi:MAG: PTS sugar transporter subunit IIA [Calditrichaeota bacterium]|nr:PTS sugar transporter subunit IIA [Calditrichota bacterium]